MDFQEILTLADELMFTQTGKHLDNLQQDILRSACNGKKYSKIAEDFHCSEGHVKDMASDLWKTVSAALGEEVNKFNFRATVERLHFSNNFLHFNKDSIQIGKFSFCGDTRHSEDRREKRGKKGRKRKSKGEDRTPNPGEDKKSGLWETKTETGFLKKLVFGNWPRFTDARKN
jgi:hypothetical protein